MRWFWVDRFLEFERGQYALSVKNVSLSEEHIHDHFPGFPVMPSTLIIEGLAQTGGILLSESSDFQRMVVLAKVPKMTFHGFATPGDTLHYHVTLMQTTQEGGIVECRARIGDQLIAEGEICFAFLDGSTDLHNNLGGHTDFMSASGLSSILTIGKTQARLD